MLVDANLLIFAVDTTSAFHERAHAWLSERLNGATRVGIPWQSLAAFLRIATHPRAGDNPLSADEAWACVRGWLDTDVVWTPEPGPGYGQILGELVARHQITGNLIPDAMLAALAIEHGLVVCSADTDFARFGELRWLNPVAPETA